MKRLEVAADGDRFRDHRAIVEHQRRDPHERIDRREGRGLLLPWRQGRPARSAALIPFSARKDARAPRDWARDRRRKASCRTRRAPRRPESTTRTCGCKLPSAHTPHADCPAVRSASPIDGRRCDAAIVPVGRRRKTCISASTFAFRVAILILLITIRATTHDRRREPLQQECARLIRSRRFASVAGAALAEIEGWSRMAADERAAHHGAATATSRGAGRPCADRAEWAEGYRRAPPALDPARRR